MESGLAPGGAGRGGRTGANGVCAASLPSLSPPQPGAFFFNLPFVLSFPSVPNGVLTAGISGVVVAGAA